MAGENEHPTTESEAVALHRPCSASLVVDVLCGNDVESGTRVIDANIKTSQYGINWTKPAAIWSLLLKPPSAEMLCRLQFLCSASVCQTGR